MQNKKPTQLSKSVSSQLFHSKQKKCLITAFSQQTKKQICDLKGKVHKHKWTGTYISRGCTAKRKKKSPYIRKPLAAQTHQTILETIRIWSSYEAQKKSPFPASFWVYIDTDSFHFICLIQATFPTRKHAVNIQPIWKKHQHIWRQKHLKS